MDNPFPNQDYLHVLTPRTKDGTTLMTVESTNGDSVVDYKETLLPMTALKHLQDRNSKLPEHLKMKINVIKFQPAPPPPKPAATQPVKTTAQTQQQTPVANAAR